MKKESKMTMNNCEHELKEKSRYMGINKMRNIS